MRNQHRILNLCLNGTAIFLIYAIIAILSTWPLSAVTEKLRDRAAAGRQTVPLCYPKEIMCLYLGTGHWRFLNSSLGRAVHEPPLHLTEIEFSPDSSH